PQPPQAVERGAGRDRADHAVAALHADDAVEINRADRAAALLEEAPASLLDLALKDAHARRGGGKRDALQLKAHRLGGDFARLGLADFVLALAGAHFRCTHRGRPDAMGVRIELDGHFHAIRIGAELDRSLERFAADALDVVG